MQQNDSVDIKIPASAAILVGGKSSRFGSDKVFMKFDDQSISGHLHDLYRKIFAEVFFISNKRKNILEDQILHVDLYSDKGPLGGLYTALKNSSYPYCFVSACDTPFIGSELIKLLWQKCGADAAVPEWNGKSEPLAAFYNVNCISIINKLIESGNLSMKYFLEQSNIERINLLDYFSETKLEKLFLNINDPESFDKAKNVWLISKESQNKIL